MKTILYNTNTNTVLSWHENGYTVDGKPVTLASPVVELTVIDPPAPEHNPATENITASWVIDLEAKQYKRQYTITAKTAYEIAMQNWQHPDYAKRIVAPMELIMDDIGIKMYGLFQINGFPVVTVAPMVHLYCNVILEAHQFVIDSLQGYITIEDRPTE